MFRDVEANVRRADLFPRLPVGRGFDLHGRAVNRHQIPRAPLDSHVAWINAHRPSHQEFGEHATERIADQVGTGPPPEFQHARDLPPLASKERLGTIEKRHAA